MDRKILKIVPAPADMWVSHVNDGETNYSRVVCLALIEDSEASRYVSPMIEGDGGTLDEVSVYSDIGGIVFSNNYPGESEQ